MKTLLENFKMRILQTIKIKKEPEKFTKRKHSRSFFMLHSNSNTFDATIIPDTRPYRIFVRFRTSLDAIGVMLLGAL